jgi:hypothetical protein
MKRFARRHPVRFGLCFGVIVGFVATNFGGLFEGKPETSSTPLTHEIMASEPALRRLESGAWRPGTTLSEVLRSHPPLAWGHMEWHDPETGSNWSYLYSSDGARAAKMWFHNEQAFAAERLGPAGEQQVYFADDAKHAELMKLAAASPPMADGRSPIPSLTPSPGP